MKPIYEPKGAAKEYGDLALNIYTGCPHRCFYCYVPNVLHKEREAFHANIIPRENIVDETRKQLQREHITGKIIHLCFTCDPYPTGYDSSATRDIIKLIKENGNNVQILTKGDGSRDFDLLDKNDRYGITLDGSEFKEGSQTVGADRAEARIAALEEANKRGIGTWVSFEPIVYDAGVITLTQYIAKHAPNTKFKYGKLNYHNSEINWKHCGEWIEGLCQNLGVEYYIKDSLRKEMCK